MFTGIIKGMGEIKAYDEAFSILTVSCPLFAEGRPALGSSIAIDGICLTASHFWDNMPKTIGFDIGPETRTVSLLTKKRSGDAVNIELALCAGEPFDGHVVQGHVDGLGEIAAIDATSLGTIMWLTYPNNIAPLIAIKGSIALNGVSLTINAISESAFSICLVPHTLACTTFGQSKVGDQVHIETDVIGRYMARFFSLNPSLQAAIRA